LSKAYVLLSSTSATRANYPVVTDSQGRFRIESVEPGNYHLQAERQGFLEGHYGGGFTGSAVQLQLSAGQDLFDLNIALTPQAVIAGHVTDPDGDIWTHVHVNVFRSVWTHGRRQIQGWSSGNVNDRGEFRIGDLPPGRYYLRADPDYAWEKTHRHARDTQPPLLLQPTWYPDH